MDAAQRERVRNLTRPTSKERGYGAEHSKARRRWANQVAAGGVYCRRCQRPIGPDEYWDLGHDDYDRGLPAEPEHRRCNRRAGGRRGGLAAAGKKRSPVVWSREWL